MNNMIAACVDRNPFDSLEELVARLAECGLDAAEWFEENEVAPWSAPEAASIIRKLMHRYELLSQYHAPYQDEYDPATINGRLRTPEETAGLITRLLDRAERLEARLVTMHCGSCPNEQDRPEAMNRFAEGLCLSVPELERRHIRIAIENHTPAFVNQPLGSRPEEMDWFMGRLPETWVGRTLDIGHAHIDGQVQGFLSRPLDRVLNCHLHDNYGKQDDHLPLGKGRIPWSEVLQTLADRAYSGALTLEFFGAAEDYRQAISRIRATK